tara:strand:+ start:69843 stop:71312 length:1470 start_codon:yes stop_codon:yes gene_type:complete
MLLTKTDFIHYLNCPESLWLLKNRPEEYPNGAFSLFLEKLIKEGYEVEEYAKSLFPQGVEISLNTTPDYTLNKLKKEVFLFQPSFITDNNVFARIDVLEKLDDDSYHIYEVKSSTSIKKDKKHNHIKDACFQKFVLQENGLEVSKVSIIHLDKEYIKRGNIIPNDFLDIENVTEAVNTIYSAVVNEVNAATTFISKVSINDSSCSCRYKTRSNHCDSFTYFNSNIPDYSIYEIGRISAKKVGELVDKDCTSIIEVPKSFELNTNQQLQVESAKQEKALVETRNIEKYLQKLKYPLHFYDYETYASAIPKLDGLKPHQHLPFQVSIHTLAENGELTHYEYLLEKMEMPDRMITEMKDFTHRQGTFISWHASFENSRNKDMMVLMPHYGEYLSYINEHTFDLEEIFKKDYVDYRFHGSTSIKKVLPVLCPQFSYTELEVQDGTMALDTWGRMVLDQNFEEDKKITKSNLLEYCKLDTMAMVEIYFKLRAIT